MGNGTSSPERPVESINHDKMLSNIEHMFRSENATQVTDMPMTDVRNYSSTSPVDVSTIRPSMTGGTNIVYTRNRYQKYEDMLMKAMKGGGCGNGEEQTGGHGPIPLPRLLGGDEDIVANPLVVDVEGDVEGDAELPLIPAPTDVDEVRPEEKQVINDEDAKQEALRLIQGQSAAAGLMSRPGNNFDIGRQMGGMSVDREIENIRSFLLNTNNAQHGGNAEENEMDFNLRMVRDNLLNGQNGGAQAFSATSENPIDYNMVMRGGANVNQVFSATSENPAMFGGNLNQAFSATSDAPVDYMIGGAQGFSATSDVPVNYMNMTGGAQAFSVTSENPIDYNLVMRGGGPSDTSEGSDMSGGDIIDQPSDSEESDSSFTDSDSDSVSASVSESSISDVGVDITDIMRLQRGINRRQNRSNFLRGDYVLTSNSDKNYKIQGRPYFSSQSSEYQNEVASEFLNTLRSRNRS
jgi:hypothetical protein